MDKLSVAVLWVTTLLFMSLFLGYLLYNDATGSVHYNTRFIPPMAYSPEKTAAKSSSSRSEVTIKSPVKPVPEKLTVKPKGAKTDSKDIDKILQVIDQMENKRPLLVTLINNAYLPFTFSWLCNTKYMGIHQQVLFITTDIQSKERLNKLWPEVKVVVISGLSANGDQLYSHAGYVRLMIRRTEILMELLQNNMEIFLFEVDCLWFKNPVPTLKNNTGYDILVNPVSSRATTYAGGFIYLFPTPATKSLWNQLNQKLQNLEKRISRLSSYKPISEGENDQIYFSGLVHKRVSGLKPKVLPLTEYADGKWYSYTEDQRKKLDPFVVNNNWVNGNRNKISRAKQWGHWFIKEDNSCDEEQIKKIVKS